MNSFMWRVRATATPIPLSSPPGRARGSATEEGSSRAGRSPLRVLLISSTWWNQLLVGGFSLACSSCQLLGIGGAGEAGSMTPAGGSALSVAREWDQARLALAHAFELAATRRRANLAVVLVRRPREAENLAGAGGSSTGPAVVASCTTPDGDSAMTAGAGTLSWLAVRSRGGITIGCRAG